MKWLTLDLESDFRRRLKARAALEVVSMRRYCLADIERQLLECEARHDDGSTTENSRK